MNKHTPAPWSIKKRGGSYLAYDLEGNTEGKIFRQNPTIAQIHFRNHYNHDGLLDENGQNFRNVDLLPVEANAKLIAAAPTMYSEIRKAQAVLAAYILPDSRVTTEECMNQLLGILDDRDFCKLLKEISS